MRSRLSLSIAADLLLLFLVLAAPSLSLADVWQQPVDISQPSSAFEKVTKEMQAIAAFQGRFLQKKEVRALRRPLTSEGTFLFTADDGLCWKTEKPFASDVVVTPDRIFQRGAGGEAEDLFTDNAAVLRGFTAIFLGAFSGRADRLAKKFTVYFQQAGETWQLGFQPKGGGARKMLKHILLSGKTHVSALEIVDANEDRTVIQFSDVSVNPQALPPAERGCFFQTD